MYTFQENSIYSFIKYANTEILVAKKSSANASNSSTKKIKDKEKTYKKGKLTYNYYRKKYKIEDYYKKIYNKYSKSSKKS